jgi:hypothetical protein
MKKQPTSIQSCSRDGDENGRTATHHYPKDLGRWILVLGAILLLSSTLCGGKPEKTGKPPKEEPPEEEPSEETPSLRKNRLRKNRLRKHRLRKHRLMEQRITWQPMEMTAPMD